MVFHARSILTNMVQADGFCDGMMGCTMAVFWEIAVNAMVLSSVVTFFPWCEGAIEPEIVVDLEEQKEALARDLRFEKGPEILAG